MKKMKISPKLTFITLICCVFFCFMSDVWCLTNEQQEQISEKILHGLVEHVDKEKESALITQIKNINKENDEQLYLTIIQALPGAITKKTFCLLIERSTAFAVFLYTVATQAHIDIGTITYHHIITAAIKSNQFALARNVLWEAHSKNRCDAKTYVQFIMAMGQNSHFNEAFDAYTWLQTDRELHGSVYVNFIFAMAKSGQHYDEVATAFGKAKTTVELKFSAYNAFIEAQVMSGHTNDANDLFAFRHFHPPVLDCSNGCIVDFHGLNFATAFLACHQILLNNAIFDETHPITLIVGQGTHSEGESAVIRAVTLFGEIHEKTVTKGSAEGNPGRITFHKIKGSTYDSDLTMETKFSYLSLPEAKRSHWDVRLIQPEAAVVEVQQQQKAETTSVEQ